MHVAASLLGASHGAESHSHAAGRARFVGLDGLRGVAAIAVVLGHCLNILNFEPLLRHYLAVDFFFLLSGFVIAHAYDAQLRDGSLKATTFIRNRLIRLQPLVILAAVIPVTSHTIAALSGIIEGPGSEIYKAGLFAMLSIPYPAFGSGAAAFVLNVAQWSLLAEYCVNLLFVLLVPWLGRRLLLVLIAAGAAIIVAIALSTGSLDHGAFFADFELGLARTIFPFFLGVTLLRLHRAGRLPVIPIPWPAQAALLLAPMLVPHTAFDPILELTAVLLVFPAIILAGRTDTLSTSSSRFMLWMGGISYPLYILHWPIVRLLHRVVSGDLTAGGAWVVVALQIALALVAAHLALKFFEKPLQDVLRGRRRIPNFIPRFSHAANR